MWVKIRPEEPLILGDVRADAQFRSSVQYIPGRFIRGAWANWLLMEGNDDILTTVQRIRIGNFFPVPEWREASYVLPIPISALTCKHEPGFTSEPHPDNRGHGVLDTLIPRLAYQMLEATGARLAVPFALTCARCGGRMEPAGGFYAVYGDGSARRYVQVRLRYHAQTKVALSRRRRASVERMLYTANALSPYTERPDSKRESVRLVFIGRVEGAPADVEALISALNKVSIGALHTRGYGRVRAEPLSAPPRLLTVEERVKRFNELLVQCWEDLKRLATNQESVPDAPDGVYFSVDLLAPGVFRRHGLPSLTPAVPVDGQRLEPICWITRPDMASGWSTAWGLPKPTNLAARAGSVYVFRWEGELSKLLPWLERLEQEGVGERCDEGFGECLICHPFHLEVEER